MRRVNFIFQLFLFASGTIYAQRYNYVGFETNAFEFRPSQQNLSTTDLSGRLNRCEMIFSGASFTCSLDRRNALGIGIGISKLNYQKEWQGIFPESNSFGVLTIDGKADYWSFPFSFHHYSGSNRTAYYQKRTYFGWSLTYTPSFIAQSRQVLNTSGGADVHSFQQLPEQTFQHSLTIGFCNSFYFADSFFQLNIEPYAGVASSYFKENGSRYDNIVFGSRFRICLRANKINISITKEVNKGNAQQKKQELLKKQQEIQEQLKNQPK